MVPQVAGKHLSKQLLNLRFDFVLERPYEQRETDEYRLIDWWSTFLPEL